MNVHSGQFQRCARVAQERRPHAERHRRFLIRHAQPPPRYLMDGRNQSPLNKLSCWAVQEQEEQGEADRW